jgi:putative phosphoesterase
VHEHHLVESLAASGRFDLVVYGHTHTPEVRTVGGTLVVNPGKAARLHKGRATAAILDTGTMEAQVVDLFDLSSCPPSRNGVSY